MPAAAVTPALKVYTISAMVGKHYFGFYLPVQRRLRMPAEYSESHGVFKTRHLLERSLHGILEKDYELLILVSA